MDSIKHSLSEMMYFSCAFSANCTIQFSFSMYIFLREFFKGELLRGGYQEK